jgi:hypothetical protein
MDLMMSKLTVITSPSYKSEERFSLNLFGDKEWYNDEGKLHRLDGPAIEKENGYKAWYVEGKCHRLDGPAVISISDNCKEWWVEGKRHRLDGPAFEGFDGYKSWWYNGELHRVDGPAIERSEGSEEWWVDGEEVTEQDYPEAVLLYKCRMVLES